MITIIIDTYNNIMVITDRQHVRYGVEENNVDVGIIELLSGKTI